MKLDGCLHLDAERLDGCLCCFVRLAMDDLVQMMLDDCFDRLDLVQDGLNPRLNSLGDCLVRLVLGLDDWNLRCLVMDGCCLIVMLDDLFVVLLVFVPTAVGLFVVSY